MQTARFFQIESESVEGKKYIVRHLPNGEWRCNCPRFIFRNQCKHVEKAKQKVGN